MVVALLGWQLVRLTRPRPFTIKSAKITKLDVAARSGEIEFTHPKSGCPTTVEARNIPPECEITVEGRPADVTALRVGDTVAVSGTFYPRDQSARPQAIHVTRSRPSTESAPTTAPSGSTP
jgi:hypothetical protein